VPRQLVRRAIPYLSVLCEIAHWQLVKVAKIAVIAWKLLDVVLGSLCIIHYVDGARVSNCPTAHVAPSPIAIPRYILRKVVIVVIYPVSVSVFQSTSPLKRRCVVAWQAALQIASVTSVVRHDFSRRGRNAMELLCAIWKGCAAYNMPKDLRRAVLHFYLAAATCQACTTVASYTPTLKGMSYWFCHRCSWWDMFPMDAIKRKRINL